MGGEKISCRKVKELLKSGEVEKANALLGEAFFLCGRVEKDRQVGRTIGFPTANIPYPQDKFPLKKGVYATKTVVDGKEYMGITNYGARPTFDNDKVVTETYLDGFSGDLYGKELTVRFVKYLRDVTKFESVDGLIKQLNEDVRRVREND
jgi:riboflavin kinase/FMN adenylyltransferase